MNETRTIRRQEHNGLGDLVRCSRTARRRLGSQLIESLTHCVRAFRARRSRAHGIDANTARAIFRRPRFGLRWCAANVPVEQDSNENLKPSKKKSHERIDGISALVNALIVALPAITGSVYDEGPPLLVDL